MCMFVFLIKCSILGNFRFLSKTRGLNITYE